MRSQALLATFLAVAAIGCGKKKSTSSPATTPLGTAATGGGAPSAASSGAKVNFSLAVVKKGASLTDDAALVGSIGQFQSVPASGANLQSLKLHIDNIQICSDVSVNGTAVGNGTGCITIYQAATTNVALDSSQDIPGALTAAAASDDGFIDVMSATSLAKLNQAVTLHAADARAYNYGVVSVSGPIKTTAIMVDPTDGKTPILYSKTTKPGKCQVNNNPAYDCAVATSDMTLPPAQEAIFMGAGGGAMLLKFQKPFTVTADDITNQVNFNLKLAFNPDGLVQGVTSGGATNFPAMSDNSVNNGYNAGNTMNLVGAQFAGIFYKGDATAATTDTSTATATATATATGTATASTATHVMRESYTTTYNLAGGTNGTARLRIEFYYIDSDPEKTIYGVSVAEIPTADTKTYLIGWQRIYGVTTNADGTINLLDYQGKPVLANFARATKVSATTTGAVACDTVMSDCTAGTPLQQQFTLDALEAL